ncbi:MAG: cation diffusion facilitator family transporter [bacterium]
MPEHKHTHSHDAKNYSAAKLLMVILLNAIITIVEIIGGIISGSLALLSDSLHNFSDTVSIVLSYFALKISHKNKSIKKTYGYKRAEVLVAFVNSSVLMALSFFLIFEAYKRFKNPQHIETGLMIFVAAVGLIANFISVFLLKKDSKESMNIKSSYLHLLSDTISSVGVILGGLAMMFFNVKWIDPLITFLISVYIIKETWTIIKQSVDILMQSSADLDYDDIKLKIENIEGVKNIHHVHTWMSNENTLYFEAHIEIDDMLISKADKIVETIEHLLKEDFKVSHTTIQIETNVCTDKSLFKS